jgi:hypothetical protein
VKSEWSRKVGQADNRNKEWEKEISEGQWSHRRPRRHRIEGRRRMKLAQNREFDISCLSLVVQLPATRDAMLESPAGRAECCVCGSVRTEASLVMYNAL